MTAAERVSKADAGSATDMAAEDSGVVLRRRATELARPITPAEDGEGIEIIGFHLDRADLALESAWVQEVFVPREVVRLPGAPPFIAGLINRRGVVYSVVDLGAVLGLPAAGPTSGAVLLLGDDDMEFGLLVERVETTQRVLLRDIHPPLPILPEAAMRYLRGVLPGTVALLDARRLLHSPQLLVDQGANADL